MLPVMNARVAKFAHFNTWVTSSVIWVVASGDSLKFVQGVSANNLFPRLKGMQDNGIRLYYIVYLLKLLSMPCFITVITSFADMFMSMATPSELQI